MDYQGVEAFLAIVRTRNLTKAAELLHLSQSTVSYRLKMLERDLGGTLVMRGKGLQTVRLTPLGESFVALAERWSRWQREVAVLQSSGPRRQLVIGAADSLNVYVLPSLYQVMRREKPELRLVIRSQHTPDSYESVERWEVDAAFVKLERVLPDIRVQPFYRDEMVLVRLEGEGRVSHQMVAPPELEADQEIYMNWGPAYQIWHDRWWDPYRPSCLQVDTAALIFALLRSERQWAVVPRSIAETFRPAGRYVFQRLSDPAPDRVCYMIRRHFSDPDKMELLEWLEACVRSVFPPAMDG